RNCRGRRETRRRGRGRRGRRETQRRGSLGNPCCR
ncbi:hypothetical protein TVAGG3_0497330, partial [Trichomonas vaginalis G3]